MPHIHIHFRRNEYPVPDCHRSEVRSPDVRMKYRFPFRQGDQKAFLTGGLICAFGQLILNTAMTIGADRETAGNWCSLLLILISVILTGLNLYSKIGKFGGAGGLVPITGFANSVAASAIEYRAEGQVFGIGCKIFTIAGPVILYGILSSWILGLIYFIVHLMEVI